MNDVEHRFVVGRLSEDLDWFETHLRNDPQRASAVATTRLSAALVRNVVGPFLDGEKPTPLHIAVVGGAGAGKSTIVNFLIGKNVAEANPQAGYTRHPTAYVTGNDSISWTGHIGFLGPLRRLDRDEPSNFDEDVYKVRRVYDAPENPLGEVVIWDCPDMTTWAAGNYVSRLVEVAGLADLIVYVASDERYNDRVPTEFLELLVRAGKPCLVVLTKMRESQASSLCEHFRNEVYPRVIQQLSTSGPQVSTTSPPVLAVPHLTPEELADPVGKAARYRVAILNQLLVFASQPELARKRVVRNSIEFLKNQVAELLSFARHDVEALNSWSALVASSKADFQERYRSEFLGGENFRKFDEAREKLLNLLELPGGGKFISLVLQTLRTPYRFLRDLVVSLLLRPSSGSVNEKTVLEEGLRAWLENLQAEAVRRAGSHPMWKHLAEGFSGDLRQQAIDRFHLSFRDFQLSSTDEIEAAARMVTVGLENNPAALGTLRGGKLTLELTAIGLGFWAGGLNWPTLIYIPLFVSLAHQGVELIVHQYVEDKRAAVRNTKELAVLQKMATPLADWLTEWPASGGTAYEKLQKVLRRIPEDVTNLANRTEAKISS
ncbi:MAG: 50S ribosome-binding GTPase [Gemmataceae bacterium]|jgi:GTP-binding protein EngB required for normal cell division|nr:50S ribosome-binding GTPase [Gemmataceae bacterium]